MTPRTDWQIVIVRYGTRAATRAEMFLDPDFPRLVGATGGLHT